MRFASLGSYSKLCTRPAITHFQVLIYYLFLVFKVTQFYFQVKDCFHSPLATIVKSIVILSEDHVVDILPVAWELLLESNQEVVATAASLFIVAAFKAAGKAVDVMQSGLQNNETAVRINAILR